jgi:GTP pyrophosphokinase
MGHPDGVARIVSDEIGLPPECVMAVYLHEAMRTDPSAPVRSLGMDESVYTMVDGLNLIATINPKDTRLEAENYKKLIIQYSRDPRVTVLKLADRLEVMRNLSLFPKTSRERKVLETLMLYIPLAHQLGLYNMKREMEDIYLSYAEPEQYRLITNKLKATEKDREALMEEFIKPLEKKLSDAGISYKLKIRTKAAYSIWAKMVKQKVPFEGVYDVFAIRFIIDCPDDPVVEKNLCWQVYSFVTEEYEPDTSRLRDWITNPKTNGYESLHITVKNSDGHYLEVQIRTRRMDEIAENGFASHWAYKGIKRGEQSMDRWLSAVRYALEHPDTDSPEELPQPPDKEIFVFTPTGELRILPRDASVLDFAFNIHSNLGSRCTGGKVNGKAVPIREKLRTGDVVEIQTSRTQHPSAAWLQWVVTSKARTKIRQLLNEAEFKKASDGKELLERRLRNWKLEWTDEMMTFFMKKRRYPTVHSFFAALGDGTLDVNEVKEFILDETLRAPQAPEPSKTASEQGQDKKKGSADDILVLGARDLKGLDYRMARCCNPVFGDDVFGFVTREEGIKIHRMTCPNAARLIEMYPYRIQKVRWSDSPSSGSFQATLRITAALESQVLNKIMEVVGNFKASIRSFNVSENRRASTYEISMKISVPSNLELDKVVSQIRILRNVIKISRL